MSTQQSSECPSFSLCIINMLNWEQSKDMYFQNPLVKKLPSFRVFDFVLTAFQKLCLNKTLCNIISTKKIRIRFIANFQHRTFYDTNKDTFFFSVPKYNYKSKSTRQNQVYWHFIGCNGMDWLVVDKVWPQVNYKNKCGEIGFG